MTLSSVLAKNSTYMALSAIAQKVLAFWWFTYVADQLLEDAFGKYQFALTYTGIFVILMNFGLSVVLTREGAKDEQKLQRYFNNVMALKVVLTIVSVVALLVVFWILNAYKHVGPYTEMLVYMAISIIVFDTFRAMFFSVLRAQQKMQYEAVSQFVYQVAVIGFGILFFALGLKAGGLIIAINLASLLYLLYSAYVVITKTTIRWQWVWESSLIKWLFMASLPFALADIFFKLNGSINTVMLEYLAGDRYVAWFNIPLKLAVTLTAIPGAFAAAFFPAMSSAYANNKEQLRSLYERFTELLLIISVPIAAGSIVLSTLIINVAFKAFPAAIPALQLYMIGLAFSFLNYPISNALNAANKQGLNTINMALALLVNVVLSFLWIPTYTYMGATAAAVCSTLVLVILGLPHVYQITQFSVWKLFRRSVLVALAAGIMAVCVWFLRPVILLDDKFKLLVLMAIGAIIYVVGLFLFRALTIAECKAIWRSLRGKVA